MHFTKKRNIRLAILSAIAALMMVLALWGGSPTQAQEHISFVFEKIRITYQSVEVRNGDGEVLGDGNFQARIRGNRRGQTRGQAQLRLRDVTYKFKFTQVDEIIADEEGNPIGVALSGRGVRIANGRRETFAATVTVRVETSVPDCLIWDIPSSPVLPEGLNFNAEGTLSIQGS